MSAVVSLEDRWGSVARTRHLRRGTRARRATIAACVATGVLAVGGAAYAWLTQAATGTGAATTSALAGVSVSELGGGDATTQNLRPGSTADVVLRVRNPNPYAVTLVSVSANGAITAASGIGTCSTSGVSLVAQSGLTVPIAASSTTLVDLPGAASMSTSSSSGCQGASFAIPVAITVHTP